MNWLNKLERKFGNICIKNLMLYIVLLNAFVFFLTYASNNYDFLNKLILNPQLVMKGEVWRLITFLFIPMSGSIFWLIFGLYFYYLAGNGLEHEWGSFKFNIYYLVGMLSTILVSFITDMPATGAYINLSLFLAFAKIYPDFELLLFFIIPIKVKYLAIFNWIFIIYNFLTAGSIGGMLLVLAPVFNYLIFFGKSNFKDGTNSAKNYRRKQKYNAQISKKETIHKCVVCGITEKDDPNMEFRYCSKCSGKQCYCIEHIKNHEHKN
ncbi:hypothetical protein JCM1393_03340 [Clostridium carnis]